MSHDSTVEIIDDYERQALLQVLATARTVAQHAANRADDEMAARVFRLIAGLAEASEVLLIAVPVGRVS